MNLFCCLARKDVQLFALHSFEDSSYQNSGFKGQTFQMTFDKVIWSSGHLIGNKMCCEFKEDIIFSLFLQML
jgi:hypothetical protein